MSKKAFDKIAVGLTEALQIAKGEAKPASDLTIEDGLKFLDGYEKFIEGFWGQRCSDYEPDCWCCKAWRRYDEERAAIDYVK